jgi:predicted transglutaminase-like cysteine proteinase
MHKSALMSVILIAAVLSFPSIYLNLAAAQNVESTSVRLDEPFHTKTVGTTTGHLAQKWLPVERAIHDELETVAACSAATDKCASDAAIQFRNIMDEASGYEGRARLAHINRAVNLAVKYTVDTRTHGIPDHWAAPFDTLESGKGDCEDYAITKFALLRAMNWPAKDLRIVIVYNSRVREYHAVEATHLGHDWLILDNALSAISPDTKLPRYHALFVIDESAVRMLDRPARADQSKINNWNRME